VSGVEDTVTGSRNGDVDDDELERLAELARHVQEGPATE
jgi:hypothetical protein